MIQMFEATGQRRYLDRLRQINDVVLTYRDDHYPGDGLPGSQVVSVQTRDDR